MPIKLDLHIHTESRGKIYIDSRQLEESLHRRHLDGIAVTNFFEIEHAIWLKKKLNDHIIIVGQEIWTKDGHIIGLGLTKRVDDSATAEDTIKDIHEQGALAVAVHPFLNLGVGHKVASLAVDAIEVYNAALGMMLIHNFLAAKAAAKSKTGRVAGSDTTSPGFIGQSYTEVLSDDAKQILPNIKEGKVKLFKRPLPIPLGGIIKGFLKFRDLEPCAIHAVPCLICGKSMSLRLFKEKLRCRYCGQFFFSRIVCCNGHFFCLDCIIKNANKDAFQPV